MKPKLAIANFVDSRTDFFELRRPLVEEELKEIDWLRGEFDCLESGFIANTQQLADYAQEAVRFGAQAVLVHLPIWADPIFTVKLTRTLPLPLLLLGNTRPETSSMVGLLGAGGALDQVGYPHRRVFDHRKSEAQAEVKAFVRAAAVYQKLRGQTLGLFGGKSLGIFTASADPAQWQKTFGVDIEYFDQLEIQKAAEALPGVEVARHMAWLAGRTGGIRYGNGFTPETLERQVRSYMATNDLVESYGVDFIGVKCQPELSDGYVSQCVAHMLFNGDVDADGRKRIRVHACESDADGALTMQIMHLLAGGKPAALLDVRWFDEETGRWTLANCGAVPAALCGTEADPSGLSNVRLEPHVFGRGGGGALPAMIAPQTATLARLCRKDGVYWMAIVSGEVEAGSPEEIQRTTPAFPKAFVRSSAGLDFLLEFGSNHIHLVSGDISEELKAFCDLAGIRWKHWQTSGGKDGTKI